MINFAATFGHVDQVDGECIPFGDKRFAAVNNVFVHPSTGNLLGFKGGTSVVITSMVKTSKSTIGKVPEFDIVHG